jgi:hypothetical protein
MSEDRVFGGTGMSRRIGATGGDQFDLGLPSPQQNETSAQVVRLVDRETRTIRQEAIERVRQGRIFKIPKDLKS